MTRALAPTLREAPGEAEIPSHQLMLRAGYLRRLAAGIYAHLPLGHRVITKIERIIREEMDRKGAQELRLPILQPAELWEETGRWADYGAEMWRVKDRHEREFCLGPTHEEIITDLVRGELRSYKQLPWNLYQIQNKFRDEIRPRFGVMRSREFIMKDAYSFDVDEHGLEQSYLEMFDAYTRIFSRCGLDFRTVEADPGAIGGNHTHEFMALADTGEASIVYCSGCDYAANVEKAEAAPATSEVPIDVGKPERVDTPGLTSVPDVAASMGATPEQVCKTLFYHCIGREEEWLVAVLVRGDRTVNETKLRNVTEALHVRWAEAEEVQRLVGVPLGYAGPVGLTGVTVYCDPEIAVGGPWIAGANEVDVHWKNLLPGRDFHTGTIVDLRQVTGGDTCPRCSSLLEERRGIEVGQVFKLGRKYSEAMRATFLDAEGREQTAVMGCYGIGVTRTMAAVIEQHHDEKGICWPVTIAPFEALIVSLNPKDEQVDQVANQLYAELQAKGVEVLFDHRDERPGVKLNDADLIGIPYRLVIGPRGLANGEVELVCRHGGQLQTLAVADAVDKVVEAIQSERSRWEKAADTASGKAGVPS